MKNALFLIVLSYSTLMGFSQKAPVKFGKVSQTELEMTVYSKDSSASAVILYDYGYFNAGQFQFSRTVRMKILTKEGINEATMVIPVSSKADVKGITFNLENGKVVETKLKRESIYEERLFDDNYRIKIAMPNVKVGSVIDIEYYYQGFPENWYFQHSIPVQWSELIIEPSEYYEFRKTFFGYQVFSISSDSHWVMNYVPAFKSEPLINSEENYIAKFEFNLLNVSFPGYLYKDYSSTWKVINDRLVDNEFFTASLGAGLYLSDIVDNINKFCKTDDEKIKAAYDSVQRQLKWDGNYTIYRTTFGLNTIFKKGIGSASEVNFVLMQLLRKLKIKAYPVAMSSRDNGLLREFSPSKNRLNYLVVCVDQQPEPLILDATEPYLPMGLLPLRAINENGRLIDKEALKWVSTKQKKKDKCMISTDLELTDDLDLQGKVDIAYTEYAGYQFRRDFHKSNSTSNYIKEIEKENPGLVIKNSKFENVDSIYKPAKVSLDVKYQNKVNETGDLLYLEPSFFADFSENPYKSTDRKFPVEYPYLENKTHTTKIKIPAKYQITEVPEKLNIVLPENGGKFMYLASIQGNELTVTSSYSVNKTTFSVAEYPLLKEFYNQMLKKLAQPVVLKVVK